MGVWARSKVRSNWKDVLKEFNWTTFKGHAWCSGASPWSGLPSHRAAETVLAEPCMSAAGQALE